MRALLVRHPWIDLILDGKKTWEIRGASTSIRETIGLIASGSGTVIGVCDLVDCIGPLTTAELARNAAKAGITKSDLRHGSGYAQTYAWVVANPRRLNRPVPYEHPSGAVIWVQLARPVERAIQSQVLNAATGHVELDDRMSVTDGHRIADKVEAAVLACYRKWPRFSSTSSLRRKRGIKLGGG